MTRSTIAAAATAIGLAVPLLLGATSPASAAEGGLRADAGCVQAGIGFLRDNGLLQAAAQQKIDYSALGPSGLNLIAVQLPQGSFLSLGQVVKLHTTHPEYFPNWC
jgi:hypothetical protein